MHLRQLAIAIETPQGVYGARIPFDYGLTVLRADNSSGKSTCMMAILYALGLEGMLGPGQTPPFTDVMLESLIDAGRVIPVEQSYVRLEVENERGVILTLHRAVASQSDAVAASRERQLIRVIEGPAISQSGQQYNERDYFVRLQFAAQREQGFHHRLAEFLDCNLPSVPNVDSGRVPLYLETLFPFFFVDQLSGWRDVKARMPTYLRIPEMAKRATEFILRLDILAKAIVKQDLEQQQDAIRLEWQNRLLSARGALQGRGVVLANLPDSAVEKWAPESTPQAMYTDGTEWTTLEDALSRRKQRLQELSKPSPQTATDQDDRAILLLRDAENQLADVRQQLAMLEERERLEVSSIEGIDVRLQTLSEELREYRDTKNILDRGGFAGVKTAEGYCPTCLQPLKDTLLPQGHKSVPMSLQDNIDYIKDEYDTYSQMRIHLLSAIEARAVVVAELRRRQTALLQQLREIRRTLDSPAGAPSAADVGELIRVEHDIDRLQETADLTRTIVAEFTGLVAKFANVRTELRNLGNIELSDNDKSKLKRFSELFTNQLRDYRFRSFVIDEIQINPETYRAMRHGYDIGLTSASDAVRMVWSYLLAMLELSRQSSLNHVGFIIFDEPKQQNTEDLSLQQLLARASAARSNRQQVIVSTSEESERLFPMLKGVDCRLYSLPVGQRLICKGQPVPPTADANTAN